MFISLWVAARPTGFYRGAQSGLTVAHTCDVYLCVCGKLGLDAICHQRGRRLEETFGGGGISEEDSYSKVFICFTADERILTVAWLLNI